MKKLLATIGVFLLMYGCAPATFTALQKNYAGKHQFLTEKNYQEVYRIIVNKARECYQRGMFSAQMVVQSDLYTDNKRGNVAIIYFSPIGGGTYFGVDIIAIDDDTTEVTIYNALSAWEPVTKAVRKWVEENYQECRYTLE